jgi:nickel superoxide dismutase
MQDLGMSASNLGGMSMRTLILTCSVSLLLVSLVLAHCQVPCGIYDDERRLDTMAEDIITVEKAIKQVKELSGETPPDYNQIVRWIQVKEQHADDIAEIASWYFLQQRVKPVEKSDAKAYEEYMGKLTLLHELMVHSMKVKQSLDESNVVKLNKALKEFRLVYLGEGGHTH